MSRGMSLLGKVYVALLVVVLFGVVIHAPLSVGLGVLWPGAELIIKAWKEIILAVAGVLLIYLLWKHRQWKLYASWPFYAIIAFFGLSFLLVPVLYTGPEATASGLLINLRFLAMFVLVYGAVKLYPGTATLFLKTLLFGAITVVGFATLQLTVLPVDVLKYIGYNEATIMPYMTVDQNPDFVRINSTLRGPNPLGAYTVIIMALLAAFVLAGKKVVLKKNWPWYIAFGLLLCAVLWATYSRGAAVGASVALTVIGLVVFGHRISRMMWVGIAAALLVLGGAVFMARDVPFVSTVILHEDPAEDGPVNSNDEHAASLGVGVQRMLAQPFGAGIGSTGSASLYTDAPIIIENQYLFIAHEVGWVGLGFFLVISGGILVLLWRRRGEWLALAAFSSGVGLAITGLVLPVWADDTVAIVWWAVAAIALALPAKKGATYDK